MICTERDEYIQSIEEDQTMWIVKLNDGTTVYQDDTRGGYQASAWERLKAYCITHGTYITEMKLKFRDHVEHLPSNQEGYYFVKSSEGFMGGQSTNNYVVGYVDGDIIRTRKYKIPELLKIGDGTRELAKNERLLIRK